MGGGGFSGNGSVEWDVQGNNVRSHVSRSLEECGFQSTAIDETPAEGVQFFTITIKLPKNGDERAAFLDQLGCTEAKKRTATTTGTITFRLPIEDVDHEGPTKDQIRVDWPSRDQAAGLTSPSSKKAITRSVKKTTKRRR
jgi:hypothetical protein